jgi:transcriptional regulator with XRE-family HTH domain
MAHPLLDKIKQLRLEKKLSQEEIAYKLGIIQSSYARFESGAKKIDYGLLEKIAVLFNTDVSQLTAAASRKNKKYNIENTLTELKEDDVSYQKFKHSDLLKRIEYLEKLNEALRNQIKDKEEIITLLKKKKK